MLFVGLNLTQSEIEEVQKKRNVSKRATEIFGKH